MKLENIRLLKDLDKSFIVCHDTQPFSLWHNHLEYELVLIVKGRGKRMIGDHIDRFVANDLVLVGTGLPHEWLYDSEVSGNSDGFQGESIVYMFLPNFLGSEFFELPENRNLKRLLGDSSRGIKFIGKTKEKIRLLMLQNHDHDGSARLYSLLSIFGIIANTKEYTLLASQGFREPFHRKGNEPMQKVLEYILQNFHREVSIKEVLNLTNMSNTAFCLSFKKTYRMTFTEYLLNTRIGYACKLLTDGSLNISQIAYNCGFENMSNFNRHFKKLKGITPSQFKYKMEFDSVDSVIQA